MKSLSLMLMTIALWSLMTGCANEHLPAVNTISNANETANIQRVVDKRVETDPALANTLVFYEVRESKTNDGFKRIQVFLKNYSLAPFTFSYRVNWYDENGVEVEAADDEMWKKVHAVPGDDVTLTTVAPQRNCGDFKVRIISRF